MRRRLILAGGAASLAATAVRAQEAGRIYRLGHLGLTATSERLTRDFTLPELERLGFTAGRNLVFDARIGPAEAMPALAREILAASPDAIVAIGSQATRAMHDATRTVPIVMFADNPVGLGVAASFSRPGGNVTGVANMVVELQAKRLDLLVEALPAARRLGALLKTSSPTRRPLEQALSESAAALGIELSLAYADRAADYPTAFAMLRAAGVEALVLGPDPEFFGDVALLVALAREARLAMSCEWAAMARAGCLLGYGAQQPALRRRMAQQIARVFRGVAPGEQPIEQPTSFELVINLAAARSLGLAIPPGVVLRADEVIE